MSPTTFLWSSPEIYGPAILLFFIGLARSDLRVLAVLGVVLVAVGAWLFRAGAAAVAAAAAEDALVSPASGKVTHLDCLLPFGHGRVVIANRDPFRDASYIVAPLDGTLTIAEPDADAPGTVRLVLQSAPGTVTLTVAPRAELQANPAGRALSRVVLLNAHSGHAVRRGEPIAFVKYGGTVSMEYPLANLSIQKELGAVLVAGAAAAPADALGRIQAVWTGPN
jgi:hypothetical protein